MQWAEPAGGRLDVGAGSVSVLAIMACLMAAWSIYNPTVTNSIIMVSTPSGPGLVLDLVPDLAELSLVTIRKLQLLVGKR